jgi:hypothetical protein
MKLADFSALINSTVPNISKIDKPQKYYLQRRKLDGILIEIIW